MGPLLFVALGTALREHRGKHGPCTTLPASGASAGTKISGPPAPARTPRTTWSTSRTLASIGWECPSKPLRRGGQLPTDDPSGNRPRAGEHRQRRLRHGHGRPWVDKDRWHAPAHPHRPRGLPEEEGLPLVRGAFVSERAWAIIPKPEIGRERVPDLPEHRQGHLVRQPDPPL